MGAVHRLKLRHLTLVVTIADRGSVVAAAQALHVTQPVVTRGLREVEDVLNVRLFDRGTRGVTPTAYGTAFLEHARAVLAQLHQAERQIDLLSRAELGAVTVGTHLAGSNLLLPRAIAALKQEHPRLTVIVREATPEALTAGLAAGDLDLVVGRLTARPADGVRQEILYHEPIRLVARVGHPVHALTRPSLAQLAGYPWIFPIEETALRAELEEVFFRAGVPLPVNRVECTSILTLRGLLITTDVVAALPMLVAADDEQLAFIDTPLEPIRRSVGVTRPADRPVSPGARALLTHLRRAASGLDPDRP